MSRPRPSVLAALLPVILVGSLGGCVADTQTVRVAAARDAALHDRAPRTRRIPRPSNPELTRNWGAQAVGAEAAYQAGATGRGVTIALIDTGVPRRSEDLSVSRASIDLIEGRSQATAASDIHARTVAGPAASALNGRGILGVAYEATLLSIRADVDAACAAQCVLRTRDVARGIDYAIANKARVIILALVSPTPDKPLSHEFEAALGRAVDAGMVVVIAGGNSGSAEPAWPARYAADPRFGGQVIAVGATTLEGDLAPWSVRAGTAREAYLAAPGAKVIAGCDDKYCTLVSGTSYSASYVAGAAALLMDAYPRLTGRQVAALLLRHAKDLGEPGPDAIYGRGSLDVAGALRAGSAQAAAS